MFPSTLSTFNQPTATDKLNSPSHSALHNTVSSAVGQIEAYIGRNGDNSVVGTLSYMIQSPDSNGGGHIQTANKGGTGQTSYTKGDTLVATSSSVLTKFAIGPDFNYLQSNSSTATGLQWVASPGKVYATASVINLVVTETSIFSTTIPGSTLGSSNVVRSTAYVYKDRFVGSIMAKAFYGGGFAGSITFGNNNATTTSVYGTLNYSLFGSGSSGSQRFLLSCNLTPMRQAIDVGSPSGSSIISQYLMGTTSVISDANQIMGLTLTGNGSGTGDVSTYIHGVTVEKIS